MTLDLVAAAILALFVAIGALRGALASALGIASFVLGYAGAIVLGRPLGERLVAAFGAPPFLAIPLGGTVAFMGLVAVLGLASRALLARERARRGDAPRPSLDRVVGAAFGALRGGFVVLLLGWLGVWLQALQTFQGPGAALAGQAGPAAGSHVTRLAQSAVESGAEALLGGTDGRVTAHVLARPAESLTGLRALLESPRVTALREDTAFWEALEAGDVEHALARGSFRALPYDTSLRRDFAALGLVDAAGVDDPKRFEQELRDVVLRVAPRLEGLQKDPELRALLDDPEVRRAVERGESLALLRNPAFQRLVTRLASGGPAPGA